MDAAPKRRIQRRSPSMAWNRTLATAVLLMVAVVVYRWISPAADSRLIGLMATAMAALPVMIIMRCFLDRCPAARR